MLNSWRPIAAALCHLLVWCCIAQCEPADGPRSPEAEKPTALKSPGKIEEARPSVYYMPDKQGNLQPVLDFKYQDFMELYKLKNRLERRDEPPAYSVQRFIAEGKAVEGYAELRVQVAALVRDDGWVKIPLRMDQGLLRGAVKHKGSGEQFLQFEEDGEGYVWWIRGKPDSQHEITMTMLAPLKVAGEQTRLNLYAPRATASELKLKLAEPIGAVAGRVSEGATLLPLSSSGDGTTEFNVVGLSGDFQLTWFKPNAYAAESRPVLESSGAVLTKLDGRSISAEATLSVRSYGAPFDSFLVRLPPGAKLSPSNPNGYVLRPVEPDKSQNGEPQTVKVRLQAKTTGPVEVRLECRRDYDPLKDHSWCELAGFEVVGAVRQWGTAAVATTGDWQVLWGASSDVIQTDQLPEGLRKEDLAAGFEYSVQPYLLSAKLVPRKSRVSVDPQYALTVESDSIQLDGRLAYTIHGAKVSTLEVAMPGWELDEVGPDDLVVADAVALDNGNLAIPLTQPSLGTVILQIRAHRDIKPGAKTISATLPRPLADSIGPMSAVVSAADNVELSPDGENTEGLVRQRTPPPETLKLPPRQQEPLYYRGANGSATFAAGFQVHKQPVAVENIVVDRAWVQTWFMLAARQDRAAYQLATGRKEIEFTLPEGVAMNQTVAIVDGKRADVRILGDRRLAVLLPGKGESKRHCVELRYHFPEVQSPRGAFSVEFPRIGGIVWVRRMNWQLVLPATEHLMGNPPGFTREFVWGWTGFLWARTPLLKQSELESWVGATSRPDLPERVNSYLFSAFGDVQRSEVAVAGRTWIVLWAAGAALVAGLLLIYVRAARHPATIFAAGLILAGVGLIAPEPTFLLAQAAILGLPLALLARLLEWAAARRRRPMGVHIEPVAETGSTRTRQSMSAIGSRPTATALPPIRPQNTGNVEQ